MESLGALSKRFLTDPQALRQVLSTSYLLIFVRFIVTQRQIAAFQRQLVEAPA